MAAFNMEYEPQNIAYNPFKVKIEPIRNLIRKEMMEGGIDSTEIEELIKDESYTGYHIFCFFYHFVYDRSNEKNV